MVAAVAKHAAGPPAEGIVEMGDVPQPGGMVVLVVVMAPAAGVCGRG